jgi:hypothetical protein
VQRRVSRRRRRRKSKKQKRVFSYREVNFWYWDCFFLLCFACAVWR